MSPLSPQDTADRLRSYIARYAALAQSQRLSALCAAGGAVLVRGLAGSALSLALAAWHQAMGCTLLFLGEEDEDAAYLYSDLQGLLPPEALCYFPSSYRGTLARGVDAECQMQRLDLVARQQAVAAGAPPCIIASSLRAVAETFVSAGGLRARSFSLRVGQECRVGQLAQRLAQLGLEEVEFVYGPGQYARRGGIVDIFSQADTQPYRVDFLGTTIDSVRPFSVETQLSTGRVESMEVVWLPEGGLEPADRQSLLDLLPAGSLVVGADLDAALGRYAAWRGEGGQPPTLTEPDALRDALRRRPRAEMGVAPLVEGLPEIAYSAQPQPVFKRNFPLLASSIVGSAERGQEVVLLADQASQLKRLAAVFDDLGLARKAYTLLCYGLRGGFVDADLGLSLFTDHQLFERYHRFAVNRQLPRSDSLQVRDMQSLKPGDYVVHVDHGVGIFEGLVRREENGKVQEYVCLSYRDKDTLLVRIHNLHRLARYRGRDGTPPTIHKLGSGAWAKVKQRAKGKMKEAARELIQLYARRRAERGFAFSPDSYLQEALEASFIYQDTPDQMEATRAVKRDMERPMPMDRLVCGDVGFGKTEIAIRAAFKAVADGKQVAVLVPTTVLALQHYKTFTNRLADLPCRVELISRMRAAKELKAVLADLRAGRVDIAIGTHALLRQGVAFHDLGLLVVDEEQKFGVTAKERLKQLRASVDTLTLTATPIPRTLQFSLMGARDLSIISTPPPNRHPIYTEVRHFDRAQIAEAIRYEMQRGGQVFFIHNVVHSLGAMRDVLAALVPEARTVMAHGQMPPAELESVMLDFMAGDYDVLLCTSIVESGLDIPNANTIIINDGHRFGLSDLHQLRGRVGRRNQKAYCYVLIPLAEDLTPEARRRLKAIQEFSDLGSGMSIAMQDLDIRGAGNLLGAEQSGFIVDLGFETYHRILDEAIHELKQDEFSELFPQEGGSEAYVRPADCVVESDLDICLPEDFVQSAAERLRLYQGIDSLSGEEELARYVEGLRDRFGSLPQQAQALMDIPPLKWRAAALGVEKVILKRALMVLQFVRPISSPFYASERFGQLLASINAQPARFQLRQSENALRLEVRHVPTVEEALRVLEALKA